MPRAVSDVAAIILSGRLLGREKAVERLAKGCRHRFYLESMIAFETAIRK
jgi:hypothetical protein